MMNMFEAGESLAGGRYRIDGLLGSGGMAQVYEAYDLRLARPVAVKTMQPGLVLDPGFPVRFRREAQAMAALGHPNVVTVHDTGEEPRPDGPPVPYFVMEMVTGGSLADRLHASGALGVAQALEIAEQVLAALAVSHGRGLVHRDIKPPNVLFTEGGAAKVADFGIVRAAFGAGTVLTGTNMVVGTPQYMSPEQVQGSAGLDGRSDLYAVGVLLFEMLTGRVPFDGEDGFAIGYRHVTEEPPSLASYGIDGQPQLAAVLARALAKRAEDRFANAEEMRVALRAPMVIPTAPDGVVVLGPGDGAASDSSAGPALDQGPLLGGPESPVRVDDAPVDGGAGPGRSGVQRPPDPGEVSTGMTIAGLIVLIGAVSLTVWGYVDSVGKTASPNVNVFDSAFLAAVPTGGLWMGLSLTLNGLGIPEGSVARISGVTSLVFFGLLVAYLQSMVP